MPDLPNFDDHPSVKLECMETGGDDPSLRFTLESGEFANRSFAADLVACPDPLCACAIARLNCVEPAGGVSESFSIDLNRQALERAPNTTAGGKQFGRAVLADAGEELWQWLNRVYFEEKNRQLQNLDFDTIDVPLPEEAFHGEMIAYQDVFCWAGPNDFIHEHSRWFMNDQYCLNPGCECADVAVSFFEWGDPDQKPKRPLEGKLFIFFDHRTGRIRVEESHADAPKPGALLDSLRVVIPDLKQFFGERHRQLQRITQKQVGKRGAEFVSQAMNQVPDLLPPPASAPARPGRNDPCPCGSGKKFKKCCGTN